MHNAARGFAAAETAIGPNAPSLAENAPCAFGPNIALRDVFGAQGADHSYLVRIRITRPAKGVHRGVQPSR